MSVCVNGGPAHRPANGVIVVRSSARSISPSMLGLCGGSLPLATPANKLRASLPAPTEAPLR
eukprot:578999-Prymnesium_polylepis.1